MTEFITGGGFANHPLPQGLKQEGMLMLSSVLRDCSNIKDLQLTTCLDSRFTIDNSNVVIHTVESSTDYIKQVSYLAAGSDYTWVIAPESSGILESIVTQLNYDGVSTINCDAESIRITGDKIKCTSFLLNVGIPSAVNLSVEEANIFTSKTVIKNRFGVGCEGLKICDSGASALEYIDDFNQWVVQPYIFGEHLSLSLLCSSGQAKILACNKQIFSGELEPKLEACLVNALPIDKQMETLANKIATAFPGLASYVGVDIIASDDGYVVIDINPRLTSSYAGLSEVLNINPAEVCMNTIIKGKLPEEVICNSQIAEVCFD
ncbi:MAG: ATP-grasp domain-containing protein [Gammaproteobacteria bacterium]|nr:ATP-grasp domain-containing protein [Gammaproteobacteria bacterium]